MNGAVIMTEGKYVSVDLGLPSDGGADLSWLSLRVARQRRERSHTPCARRDRMDFADGRLARHHATDAVRPAREVRDRSAREEFEDDARANCRPADWSGLRRCGRRLQSPWRSAH